MMTYECQTNDDNRDNGVVVYGSPANWVRNRNENKKGKKQEPKLVGIITTAIRV